MDMIHGSIVKSLVRFMIPVFFTLFFQELYLTVDAMIVGHFLGEASLAAVGSASSVYDLMMTFAFGFSNGISVVISRSYGMEDEEMIKKSVGSAIVISISISIFMMILAEVIVDPLLKVTHTPGNIMGDAKAYIHLLASFVIVTVFYNVLSGLLRGIGNSLMPLIFLLVAAGSNVGLDLLFIGALGMDVEGAALATVIAQTASVILCLIYILTSVRHILPEKRHFAPDRWIYTEMTSQGLAMAMMNCVVSAGSLILQSGINSMGDIVIAGHVIARKMIHMLNLPTFTLSQSTITFVAQNRGAQRPDRVKAELKVAAGMSFVVALVESVLIWPTAPALARFLSGSENEILIYNAANYIRIAVPFTMVLGILVTTRVALQGMGDKVMPVLASVIELIGKILFTIFLVPVFHYKAIWWCEPVIWTLMTIELVYAFYKNPFIRGIEK